MRLNAILFFIFSFLLGIYIAYYSWDGVRYVSVSDWRSPAAIRGLRDLSSLRGASLSSAAEFQVSSQSKLVKTKEGIEIYLNQFVMRDAQDKRNFVCRVEGRPGVFDRVELTLVGLGISEAGKRPQISVEVDCKSQPSSTQIGPIRVFLPMAEIYQLKPVDQDLNFYDDLNSTIRISQMVSQWPNEWRLEKVKYSNSLKPEQILTLLVPKKENPSEGAFSLNWTAEEFSTVEPTPQTF